MIEEVEILNTFTNKFLPIIILIFAIVFLWKFVKFLWFKIKVLKYQKKLAKSGMYDIDRMDGLQFESYLKALLKELGYKSKVTSGSHDFGADIIMKNNRKKVVIQAKRYGYKNKVSLDAIQQIYTAKTYYNADQAVVITNSTFTKSASELAQACNVKLYDRYKLTDLINKLKPEQTPKNIINTIPAKERKCKSCGGRLIQRKSKAGNHFLGCNNYPRCTHTEPIAKT